MCVFASPRRKEGDLSLFLKSRLILVDDPCEDEDIARRCVRQFGRLKKKETCSAEQRDKLITLSEKDN